MTFRSIAMCLLACASFAAPQTVHAQALSTENFVQTMFATFCLSTNGDTAATNAMINGPAQEFVTELDSEEIARLSLGDGTSAWLINGPSGMPSPVLSITASGACLLTTTIPAGTLSASQEVFENVLQRHTTRVGGELFNSGDAEFLNDPTVTGSAYTLKSKGKSAHLLIIEQADDASDTSVLKISAIYK